MEELMSKTVEEMALEERKFLHDISNQLVVAQGMGSFVLRSMNKKDDVDEKDKQRMEKTLNAVNQIITMVKERREVLHSLS